MQRRTFIITSASLAGGIVIGGSYVLRPEKAVNPLDATLEQGQTAITPYVIVDSSGVTIISPRAEMGQGIHGTLAALVAEELDIPLAEVNVEHGPASKVYANTRLYGPERRRNKLLRRVGDRVGMEFIEPRHVQLTGAQASIRDAFTKMRKAGAAARAVLVEAAAKKLKANANSLYTENGAVVHPDGRRIPYTSLAAEAVDIEPPQDPKLKPRSQWTQLGQSQPRVDMVSKCMGTAEFAVDVTLPGMLYATVLLNPQIDGGVLQFDDSKAKAITGFIKAIAWKDGIIVVAKNTWYAMQAAQAIEVEWGPAPYPESNEAHREALVDAIDNTSGHRMRDDGNVDELLTDVKTIEASYHVPYLAHATMEPMNAVAWLKDGQLDIWAGNQNPLRVRYYGARVAGVSEKSVNVHTTYMGGGFGRRLESDFIEITAFTARAMRGQPVKVMWSRETDMRHDVYRPMATAKFRGSVSDGKPVALDLHVSSPSLRSSAQRRAEKKNREIDELLDKFSTTGAIDQPYQIENYRVTAYTAKRLLPVGWWRGVGETQNVFFQESAIDELAHAGGIDPLAMRLSMLDHAPSQAVLEAVAEMSTWGSQLPDGHAQGMAYALSSGAATAQVVEVRQTERGIRIEKVFAAVDVGIALDPQNIEAQVQSSISYGLCAAMHSAITVKEGGVEQSNFDDYPLIRINQAPPIDVHIHESGSSIYGVGESGTPTAAPALGNAIFALTGRRVRELPFSSSLAFL